MIYFIEAEGTDWIKVGFASGKVGARVAELQVGCPFTLNVLDTFDGDMKAEMRVHRVLADARGNGEWFRRKDAMPLLRAIRRIGLRAVDHFARLNANLHRGDKATITAASIPPTRKQLRLLRFMTGYQQAHGHTPSIHEMLAGIGSRSSGSLREALLALEERGHIRRLPGWRTASYELLTRVPIPRDPEGAPLYAVHREADGNICHIDRKALAERARRLAVKSAAVGRAA